MCRICLCVVLCCFVLCVVFVTCFCRGARFVVVAVKVFFRYVLCLFFSLWGRVWFVVFACVMCSLCRFVALLCCLSLVVALCVVYCFSLFIL